MTDLGTDWSMMKFTDKEALGKEHTEVVGQEFGFTHAVLCGSETNRDVHQVIGSTSLCLKSFGWDY